MTKTVADVAAKYYQGESAEYIEFHKFVFTSTQPLMMLLYCIIKYLTMVVLGQETKRDLRNTITELRQLWSNLQILERESKL